MTVTMVGVYLQRKTKMTEIIISDKPVGVGYSYVNEFGNNRAVREKRAKVVSKLSRQLNKQLPDNVKRRCSAETSNLRIRLNYYEYDFKTKVRTESTTTIHVEWAKIREPTTKEQVAGRLIERRIGKVIEVTRTDTEAANIAIDKINEILKMDLKHLEEPSSATNRKVQEKP